MNRDELEEVLEVVRKRRVDRVLLWLRIEFLGRKWLVVIAAVFVLLIAFEIGEALLPHRVLNTKLEYEEKSNGVREYRHGIHLSP
jgi:hypothetical protein